MSGVERPNNDVLVLHLSEYHSLDLVRLPGSRKYRIVFAERWGVQRRAFVEISFDEALAVARFLVSVDNNLRTGLTEVDPFEEEVTPPLDSLRLPQRPVTPTIPPLPPIPDASLTPISDDPKLKK